MNQKELKTELELYGVTRFTAGTPITCTIQNYTIDNARIQIHRDEFYICQNVTSGSSCPDKLGYGYSWSVGKGTYDYLCRNEVVILSILMEEEMIPFKNSIVDRVKKYISDHSNSILTFSNWMFDKDYRFTEGFDFINLDELDKLVITILYLAREHSSADPEGRIETGPGRARSVIDVWRHCRAFDESIDIFSVMRSLFKVTYHGTVFGTQFCSTVKRVVFPYGVAALKHRLTTTDEFMGTLANWRDIKE
jgi:hypothetical protein